MIDLYRVGKAISVPTDSGTYLLTVPCAAKIIEQTNGTSCEWWDGNPANPALTNPTPRMVARTANSAESFSDRIHAGVNECFRFKHGVFVKPVGACNLAVYLTAAPTGYQGS